MRVDYDYEDTPRYWGEELLTELAMEEYHGRNR